jgi:hypothetical protein
MDDTWKQNRWGIEPEQWARLVKLRSHAETQAIWDTLAPDQRESWEDILLDLDAADAGRYGIE